MASAPGQMIEEEAKEVQERADLPQIEEEKALP